ncbi:MAG: ATP-binding cassette domain-containing protein [Planctomycetes bacterium]|nr:ATP-binding cassette domain-containing protein [Planctomycetota bacterium]
MSLVVQNVTKNYGAFRAVDRVSFEIRQPGLVGLIGPNGAGKSSVLRMLATFLQPSSGSIQIGGCDTVLDPLGVQRQIGYSPEQGSAQQESRVEEYLAFRARLKGLERRTRQSEIDRCLAACQLTAVRRRLIGRLSLGFRRRVGLADALLGQPPVLLLDEPTIGLDPLQVRETRRLLADVAQGSIVLLSTHLLAEAEGLCDRILVLIRGRLVSDLRLAELQAQQGFEIELAAPLAECQAALGELPTVTAVAVQHTAGGWHRLAVSCSADEARVLAAQVCIQRGWSLRELRSAQVSLEEHFVRLSLLSDQRRGAA